MAQQILIAVRSVASLSAQTSVGDVNSGSHTLLFPKSLPTGTYYLAAIADRTNAVTELSGGRLGSPMKKVVK